MFSYTLKNGDSGIISIPETGMTAPDIIGGPDRGAYGYAEPINPRLSASLNSNNRFYGKYGTPDVSPYTGINSVSATPQVITYTGVDNPVINLYHDGDPDTYGTNILPAPQHATAGMTYTLTKADGNILPAGLVFDASSRKVSIGSQTPKPPKTGQYRLTAADASIEVSLSLDVTIRYAQRPTAAAYAIVGPDKGDGYHDDNTYTPGSVIEFRINYGADITKTAGFDASDHTLDVMVGTTKRTASFTRLDTHVIRGGNGTDHNNNRQIVFSYTLQVGDSGTISIPVDGMSAPGIAGGGSDPLSSGHGEVINPRLPVSLNGATFMGKSAENGITAYKGANRVAAAAQSITFTGTTPAAADAVTLYVDGSNSYTPPTPLHAVAPITWSLSLNQEIQFNTSSGMLSALATGQTLLNQKAYTVTAADSRGLVASFNIAVTVQEPPLLIPSKIWSDAAGKGGDEVSSDGYYSKVGGTIIWTPTYPQVVFINLPSKDSEKTKLRLQIGKHIREVPAHGNGTSNADVQFRYQLQTTDMDNQITIADPPLLNPRNISATVDGKRAVASSNRQDAIWNWPVGTPIARQVTKVDGNPQSPTFPAEGPNEVVLLENAVYSSDPDQTYLRNTLAAATSPTIANYGPLTYTLLGRGTLYLSNGARFAVKNGVPSIVKAAAPPLRPTVRHKPIRWSPPTSGDAKPECSSR